MDKETMELWAQVFRTPRCRMNTQILVHEQYADHTITDEEMQQYIMNFNEQLKNSIINTCGNEIMEGDDNE